jgi:hypothetical protein
MLQTCLNWCPHPRKLLFNQYLFRCSIFIPLISQCALIVSLSLWNCRVIYHLFSAAIVISVGLLFVLILSFLVVVSVLCLMQVSQKFKLSQMITYAARDETNFLRLLSFRSLLIVRLVTLFSMYFILSVRDSTGDWRELHFWCVLSCSIPCLHWHSIWKLIASTRPRLSASLSRSESNDLIDSEILVS